MAAVQVQPLRCLSHDLEAFLADIGFGYHAPPPAVHPHLDMAVEDQEEDPETSAGSADVVVSAAATAVEVSGEVHEEEEEDEGRRRRRLRRRISNRESARRSRARKQRHLEEQRAAAEALRGGNRDLSARLRGARTRAGLVALANARLRAEAHVLGRRLAAARRALALRQLYDHYAAAGLDVQTQLSSLIA